MNFKIKIIALFKRLFFAIILMAISRYLLYVFNHDLFKDISFGLSLKYLVLGLRFDISSVLITNSLLIILYILPFKFTYNIVYQKVLNVLFIVVNSISVIANLSDVIYFRFTLKRTTAEFVNMFSEDSNMFKLIPNFILDYWYITLIGIVLILLLVWGTRKTNFYCKKVIVSFFTFNLSSIILSIFIMVFTVIGIRGGTQLRPVNIIDATKYSSGDNIGLVLNTPFTIIKTIGKTHVKEYDFYEKDELDTIIETKHNYIDNSGFRPLNVVVIIMESMSKEHSAFFNKDLKGKGFTPFLDSLMQHSLVCEQAYANGRKSIEGIPAVVSSFPSFLNNAFISSNYSTNKLNSLANLLDKKGYNTAFYHGGNNGTMGFDNFVKSIGYNNYYGRYEYDNDDDFDGLWGIFDDKFFSYFGRKLSMTKQPFLATIFSLSAHHPYTIPKEYIGKFPKGKIPIQQAMAYSDFALSQFFAYAKNQEWYNNTIFVITADHTSEIADQNFNNPAGKFAIPILYFMPSDSLVGNIYTTTQQLDIMPSILDYLNYDINFYSLGRSIFSKENNFSISFNNGVYQLISGDSLWQYIPESEIYDVHSFSEWKNLQPNTNNTNGLNMRKFIKAFIQKYNYDLVNDKMHY